MRTWREALKRWCVLRGRSPANLRINRSGSRGWKRDFPHAVPFTFCAAAVCWLRPRFFFCLANTQKSNQGGTMAGTSQRKNASPKSEKSTRHKKHPIRVVPMHPGAARVAQAPAAQLTYRGGLLLSAVQVFTIFWGAAWQDAANSALMTKVNQFFDYILTSALMDQLGEYSVDGQSIGHGSRVGTTVITSQEPGSSVQDSDIQNLIGRGIGDGTLPATTANSLYFVFLPNGVQVVQG